jgi:hypothetical protein
MKPERQARLINRKKAQYEKIYAPKFRDAIWKQLALFRKEVAKNPIIAANQIDLVFTPLPIQKVWQEMFRTVANAFRIDDPDSFTKQITDTGWEGALGNYLLAIGGDRITEINTTTKNFVLGRLRPILNEGIREGASIDRIAEAIVSDIREYSGTFGRYRAERIVRTEINSTANWGSYTSVEMAGIGNRLLKRWLPASDDRTREAHAGMIDHPAIPFEDDFNVPRADGGSDKMKYPGDMTASAGNLINCRCTVVYERIE